MDINLNIVFKFDPSSEFKTYLEGKFMALQDDLTALAAAVSTLTADVLAVNTDVLAVLAKLAAASNITPAQQQMITDATAALTVQNTAIEAVDAELKAVLP